METAVKARREAAILVFVVFFLGLLLGGLGNHLWGTRVWGEQRPPAPATRDQIMANFTRELQLTSDQQKQLSAILDNSKVRYHDLNSALDEERMKIRDEGRAHMRAMLTPEQQPKFDAFMQRLDEQRKQAAAQQPQNSNR